jgi:hypothetical protein
MGNDWGTLEEVLRMPLVWIGGINFNSFDEWY